MQSLGVGCRPAPAPDRFVAVELDRYGDELYRARSAYEAQVSDGCAHGSGKACPSIAEETSSAAFRAEFVAEVCGETAPAIAQASEECARRFADTVVAKLAQRYALVGEQPLRLYCRAEPTRCHELANVEAWMIEEHERVATSTYSARILAANLEHRDRLVAAAERDDDAMKAHVRETTRDVHRAFAFADILLGNEVCMQRELYEGGAAITCYPGLSAD